MTAPSQHSPSTPSRVLSAEGDLRVAVDTGGTFTDLVARLPDGNLFRTKTPSTPAEPAAAIVRALTALQAHLTAAPGAVAPPPLTLLAHGTTVATNALLERTLARVVLITNAGHEDLLHLRRQSRPDLYALHPAVSEPLTHAVVGIATRRGPQGEVVTPIEDVRAWLERNRATLETAEAFAISLLHAYADGEDERQVEAALTSCWPDRPITTSHALCPVIREYERTATVALNAALRPRMSRYLGRLAEHMGERPVEVMASSGGRLTLAEASEWPAHTVLSGPAGGVRGTWGVGRRLGRSALLTLDIGGTSTDVSVVEGALIAEDDGQLGGHPLRVPLLPIETIGAGGGSIAFVDEGGALRVGPRSAGASPGPACYGQAGEDAVPTVTDAQVALGRITQLLGGAFPLHPDLATRVIAGLAGRLETPPAQTAAAIIAVTEANMVRACKRVSLERGIDPRRLTLVAFGGAGGLHACAVAESLGCPEVIFPAEPGVLSAEGILDAPREISRAATMMLSEADWDDARLAAWLLRLSGEVEFRLPGAQIHTLAECRYAGQAHALRLPIAGTPGMQPARLRAQFDAAHLARYGYALPSEHPVELVGLRVVGRREESLETKRAAETGERRQGPSALTTYSATLWLPMGWFAVALTSGDWICRRLDARILDSARVVASSSAPDSAPGHATPPALALEIHRQRLAAIAEEMGAVLMRAAFSANIRERRDFSCAVFDAAGLMLTHAAHIPVHLGSTPLAVRAAIDHVQMATGDAVLLNDPFCGGTHLPDVTLVCPVFLPGESAAAFYVANRAHHADVGGISPGSMPAPHRADGSRRALTIDDEGFRLGPTRLTAEVRADFARASRVPDERLGDLRAQEAANAFGVSRLIEWATTQGRAEIDRLNDALLDYSEQRVRRLVGALPDGDFAFTDALDDDGYHETPVPIPVSVQVRGETLTVDLRSAPDQTPGSMNAVRAIAVSAVFYALRCLGGAEIPANAGLLRPVKILTRPGSILDASPPAAVSAGNCETSQRLVDALFGALAQAAPMRIPAASCGTMNNVLFGGIGPKGPFVHYETLGGGAGGGPEGRGASAIHVHLTNTDNTPIEALEHAFPVRVERYALAPVSTPEASTTETHAGGRGVERVYRFLVDAEVTLITERRRLAPWGLGGGRPGARGKNRLLRADGQIAVLPGKVTLTARAGDAVQVVTPGGGGFGFNRDNGGYIPEDG